MQKIVYFNNATRKIKIATHALFDEALYNDQHKPPGAQRLVDLGLKDMESLQQKEDNHDILTAVTKHPMAISPIRFTPMAAGYDLHSVETQSIQPGAVGIIDTCIQIQLPPGTYRCIVSRSGLVVKHYIEVKAGVIDPDYTGTLKVVLHNFGTEALHANQGGRIVQLILENYNSTHIQKDDSINKTERGVNGFGSTGITSKKDIIATQVSM
jgi:dUTP pyrophosphatase